MKRENEEGTVIFHVDGEHNSNTEEARGSCKYLYATITLKINTSSKVNACSQMTLHQQPILTAMPFIDDVSASVEPNETSHFNFAYPVAMTTSEAAMGNIMIVLLVW